MYTWNPCFLARGFFRCGIRRKISFSARAVISEQTLRVNDNETFRALDAVDGQLEICRFGVFVLRSRQGFGVEGVQEKSHEEIQTLENQNNLYKLLLDIYILTACHLHKLLFKYLNIDGV